MTLVRWRAGAAPLVFAAILLGTPNVAVAGAAQSLTPLPAHRPLRTPVRPRSTLSGALWGTAIAAGLFEALALIGCAFPAEGGDERSRCDDASRNWAGVGAVIGASIGTLVGSGSNHDLAEDESPSFWERDADDRGVAPVKAALLRPEGGGSAAGLGFGVLATLGPAIALGPELTVDLGSYHLRHGFALRLGWSFDRVTPYLVGSVGYRMGGEQLAWVSSAGAGAEVRVIPWLGLGAEARLENTFAGDTGRRFTLAAGPALRW
jgi:hypothetical protein